MQEVLAARYNFSVNHRVVPPRAQPPATAQPNRPTRAASNPLGLVQVTFLLQVADVQAIYHRVYCCKRRYAPAFMRWTCEVQLHPVLGHNGS